MLNSSFVVLFSPQYSNHRDLHSFPTRRSSDLGDPQARLGGGGGGRPGTRHARAEQDRKSTRLNSSHTVKSYAVFCLKKKKHGVREHHRERSRPAARQ